MSSNPIENATPLNAFTPPAPILTEFAAIIPKLQSTRASRDELFSQFTSPIETALKQMGIQYEIKERVKSPYSIWNKMQNKHVTFEEIYDILAGTFLVIGLSEDDFASLEDTHIKQFSEVFKTPEMFARINGKLVALPIEEEREPKPSFADQLHEAEGKTNAGTPAKKTIKKDEVER